MTTKQHWPPREIEDLVERLESSGLSVAEFARRHEIPAHRLYWARRRRRAAVREVTEAPATFDEVAVVDAPAPQAAPIELQLRSGMSIRVTRDFDEVALRRLLGLLSPC